MAGSNPSRTTGDMTPVARARAFYAANPEAVAAGLYGAVALAAFIAAYFAIFTQFQAYDDEGTLLATIKAFVQGDALYRDIYTPYGPFYYELFGGLFALTGWSVSTDASRLIVIVIWVATSGLYGLAVQRLTGRLSLGVTGMLAAFAALAMLAAEPMHPHGLAVLLLAAFTLVVAMVPLRHSLGLGVLAGALLAALALTKVNLGAFAIAAVALAAALTAAPLSRPWLRWPVVLAFLAMPVAVMARDLNEPWVRDFIALVLLATAAILVAAWPARWREPTQGDADLWRWLLGALAGAAATTVAVLSILLLTGLSPADVYRGIVEQGLDIRDAYVLALLLPGTAAYWAVAAVVAAALVMWLRPRRGGAPSVWTGALRVAVGVAIWVTITRSAPFSIGLEVTPIALPLVLAWVAAIPPAGLPELPYMRFLRVLLPALAVGQTLQVYPVAGSQQAVAALAFLPVGAICIADGLRLLRAWSAARGRGALLRFGAISAVVIVALGFRFGVESIVNPGATNLDLHSKHPAMPFPGTTRMRIAATQVKIYEHLVGLLHEQRCTSFASYPSFNSIYLWSGLKPPRPGLPGPWMRLLDDGEQQRVVDQLRAMPRPCVIRNDGAAASWLQGASPDAPLIRYVLGDEFEPVAEVGDFQFLVPRRSG